MLFCEKYGKAIDFLLEKSNIAVRYRVTRELCDGSNPNDLENLQEELIYSEERLD